MCSLCQLPEAKNHNFGQIFDNFGRSCTDRLLPMRAQFGVLEQTQGLHLPAKFHLNVFIVPASGGKKTTTVGNLGTPVLTPFYRRGPNLVCYTQGLHVSAKFHLNVFIVSVSDGQKPQFWANFDIFGAPVPTFFHR